MGKTKNKKRNKKKTQTMLSPKDKTTYNILFGAMFILSVSNIYWVSQIYHLVMKIKNYDAVFQNEKMIYANLIVTCLWVIIIAFYYNRFYNQKTPIKDIKKALEKQKSLIILPVILFLVSAVFIGLNYTSYNYIENGCYYHFANNEKQVVFSVEDIEKEEISIVDYSHSFDGKGRIINKYYVQTVITTKGNKYTLLSDSFYGYDKLYNYITNSNCSKDIDKTNLDKILAYESNNKNNTEIIKKIFD
jgi:cell division protein FtsL